MAREKVVLAYSGGLDTAVLERILTDDYRLDVIEAHVDVGEAKDPEHLKARAKKAGAIDFEFIEGKREYVTDFICPALQANALYEGVYPLNAALSRAMIARHLVALAKKHGASAIAHGATGKGNDQVRFDLSSRALDPALKIIAPQRERYISRDFAIEYAKKHGIEVPATVEKPFSIDENLWGRSIEGGVLEDPNTVAPESAFAWTRSVKDSPNSPTTVEIGFEAGLPVSLDGERLPAMVFILAIRISGGRRSQSNETGSPASKPISTVVGELGLSLTLRAQPNADSGATVFGSSRTPPSIERPHRFSSIEKGFSTVAGTSIPCFLAYSIAKSRLM